eukprot:GDKH01025152.1.p1 GENE.GDKH01025152.1~~GDKH01025152.1.p1  ORF type:complete len:154 (+),score=3.96 GDKH01025152.1:49-510(+)
MKKTLIAFSLLAVSGVSAQEVISSSGESFATPNGGVDFTVGEVVIETVGNGSNTLTQGFHQTLLEIVGLEDHLSDLQVSIFPNPTDEFLMIEVSDFSSLKYQLVDQTGRLVNQDELKSSQTQINVTQLSAGVYTLFLTTNETKVAKSYQVIKH